jgi:DNA primase
MPKSRYVDFRAVKQAVTIVQILDHYKLTDRFQRKDDSLSGPCPIHKGENSTQFRVSVSKNCWNCLGECEFGGKRRQRVLMKIIGEGLPSGGGV